MINMGMGDYGDEDDDRPISGINFFMCVILILVSFLCSKIVPWGFGAGAVLHGAKSVKSETSLPNRSKPVIVISINKSYLFFTFEM